MEECFFLSRLLKPTMDVLDHFDVGRAKGGDFFPQYARSLMKLIGATVLVPGKKIIKKWLEN